MAKKSSTEDYEGVVAYLAPAPASLPKLPAHLGVRIIVDRLDGGNLTAEDLAAAAVAFPRKKPAAKGATRAKKAPAKKTTTPKRAAAKKPARGR